MDAATAQHECITREGFKELLAKVQQKTATAEEQAQLQALLQTKCVFCKRIIILSGSS